MRQQDGLAYLDDPESSRAADGGSAADEDDDDDARTEHDYRDPGTQRVQDEGGAHTAFVAGLLYTLTKRVCLLVPSNMPISHPVTARSWSTVRASI